MRDETHSSRNQILVSEVNRDTSGGDLTLVGMHSTSHDGWFPKADLSYSINKRPVKGKRRHVVVARCHAKRVVLP